MAARPSHRQDRLNDTTPDEPQVTPSGMAGYGMPNHDFTLQTIMQLQRTVGSLEGSVAALSKSIESQCEAVNRASTDNAARLDAINNKISGITHKIYAAGVVLAIAVVLGGWVVNKSWDLISAIAVPTLQETVKQTAASSQALPADPSPSK